MCCRLGSLSAGREQLAVGQTLPIHSHSLPDMWYSCPQNQLQNWIVVPSVKWTSGALVQTGGKRAALKVLNYASPLLRWMLHCPTGFQGQNTFHRIIQNLKPVRAEVTPPGWEPLQGGLGLAPLQPVLSSQSFQLWGAQGAVTEVTCLGANHILVNDKRGSGFIIVEHCHLFLCIFIFIIFSHYKNVSEW